MRADLSPRGRAANLERMARETFDAVIVGGGIVGAGIAREAATRGLDVALLERCDFASGTSGKTSRMVHGGLRYLRDLRVGLVRTAVRERDILLRQAPGLVRPVAFTIPSYDGRGEQPLVLRLGLWLYDVLSRDKALPRRRWLAPAQVTDREPGLQAAGLRGGGLYHDAVTDDARLVVHVLRAAADAGAVLANHAEAVQLLREAGQVVGVRAIDRPGNRTLDVRGTVVVNATGVWLDRLRDAARGTLRPTKGVHVLLPRDRVGNQGAVVLRAKRDGRVLFVLPWRHLTLVGTTDTDYAGDPDDVVPDAEDVMYLLESVNEAFPEARAIREDVVSAYAGLRPLIRTPSRGSESDLSRAHAIFEDPDRLISVAGGKLTTQRAMAEEVVDRVAARLSRHAPSKTRGLPLGPPPDAQEAFRALGFADPDEAHLCARHDPEAIRPWIDEPGSRDRIAQGAPHLWVEAIVAVEEEMALDLADVMVRRLGLFYELPDQGIAVAPAVAARLARHLGWSPARVRGEVQAYGDLVDRHRRFRGSHGT